MKTNYQAGHDAEKRAADYLTAHGYSVRELNWKTRVCEIDIIAERDDCIFFVEVKYRKSAAYGDGFDYVTDKKQRQMEFAAKVWLQGNDWPGEVCLAALSITDGYVEFMPLAL